MKIKKNKENSLSFEVDEKIYNVIDTDGQMVLKEIYNFVKENFSNKESIIENLVFDDDISKENQIGLSYFIKELLNRFTGNDFDFNL